MRAAAGQDAGNVGWDGSELVAVRLHLPSKITFHNSPSRKIERGNIVVWEQPLSERQKGTPLEVQARMETQSILFRTLALFGAMGVLVVITFIAAIWYVKSRKPQPKTSRPQAQTSVRLPRFHRLAHFRVGLQLVLQREFAEARSQ